MPQAIRHDALALNAGADVDAFERFMNDDFMPHLADRFKGPTRTSKADLKSMSLLRSVKSARGFLLVTMWEGDASSVAGAAFENARMNTVARTGLLLDKLEGFVKRSPEKVFVARSTVEVPTNV